MPIRRNSLLPLAIYVAAGLVLATLFVVEAGHDRLSDCLGIGAFSQAECEEYAKE